MTELRGPRVRLVTVTAADGPALRAIHEHPVVARWWGTPDAGFPMADEPQTTRFTIHHEGAVAGLIQYGEEDEPHYRHAWIDIFVAPAHHGRGVCREAIGLLVDHLVAARGHHRVVIDPALENVAAIACYLRAGFVPVGVQRRAELAFDGSGWRDSLLMELVVEPGGIAPPGDARPTSAGRAPSS